MNDYEINKFYNYAFSTPIELQAGTFYVGWEQINIAARYVIGFDLSQNNIDKIYTFKNNLWGQKFTDIYQGTAMIRPYFGVKRVAALNELHKETQLNLYPNPTQSSFTVYSKDNLISTIDIFNINGQLLIQDAQKENNLVTFELPNGMYIAVINTDKGLFRKRFVVLK